jgi:dTDP-4-dehydrorhamnose reductase
MTRLLILGGSGMLGHKLWQTLSPRFDTFATFRGVVADYSALGIFDQRRILGGIKADELKTVEQAFASVRPEVVVNCIGVVKQEAAGKDPIANITVNALFPHHLAKLCDDFNARLIHLSTDCVFSGEKGNYVEGDVPDATDLYGRSKLLGEVTSGNALTIRTSMIGPELSGAHGLFEWFRSNAGKRVRGFKRAIFSGFTTGALADVIGNVIDDHRNLKGIYHVAADPINKFNLLTLINEIYGLRAEINADETFVCDRSLDGTLFRSATGFIAPSWRQMIEAMKKDPTPYEDLRTPKPV